MAYALASHGDLAAALPELRQCRDRDPDHLQIRINLCRVLLGLGRTDEALTEAWALVRLHPGRPEGHLVLGDAAMAMGQYDRALQAVEAALVLEPDHTVAQRRRLHLLEEMAREEELLAQVQRYLGVFRHRNDAFALAVLMRLQADRSQWKPLRKTEARLHAALSAAPDTVSGGSLALTFDDPELLFRCATHRIIQRPHGHPPRPAPTGRPLRVGYLSADLRDHPVARVLVEVLRHHDRQQIQTTLLSLKEDDGSSAARAVRAAADAVVNLTDVPDAQAVARIRALELDVLVDLMGSSAGSRAGLLALGSAPRQVLWLGVTSTTGMGTYDAYLTDAIAALPSVDPCFTEPLRRLGTCYHPIEDLGRLLPAPPRQDGHLLIGLPQTANRVRPACIEALARTLAPHPHTVLLLRGRAASQDGMRKDLAGWGLPPERVRFLDRLPERDDYLRTIATLDLYVDSSPQGGHSTAGEAMALGVPVVTATGRGVPTRVAASMLHHLGLPEGICPDMTAQMALITRLVTTPDLLAEHRQRAAAVVAGGGITAHNQRLARALETSLAELARS